MESILNSVKKGIGQSANQTHFDPEIIMHINSVFSNLHQMGVGPEKPYRIEDDINSWSEFIQDDDSLENVKTYIYLKVKLLFDPPTNSAVIAAMKEEIKELEYRLSTAAELKN